MMRKDVFDEVNGFDEKLSHSYKDIDLCLQIRQQGYRIIFTPYVELYHFESQSRGCMHTPENQVLFRQGTELFKKKWHAVLKKGDPYYNINLALDREDFSIRRE